MNTKRILVLTLCLCGATGMLAQGTAFTYQGRLLDQGSASNGRYEMEFSLWDALSSGVRVAGPVTNSPVNVSNGLFSVTLDFGSAAFPGAPRWLQIGVRTNGSAAAFGVLSPRQSIAAAPYAVLAGNFTGAIADGQLSANIARLNASQSLNGDLTILNPYDLSFGANTRQMLNLWRTNYGLGVQNNTLYQRSDGGFAWFRSGQHDNTANSAGTNGTTLMVLSANGSLGLGTNAPAHRLDVNGNADVRGTLMVNYDSTQDPTYPEIPGLLFGDYNSGEVITSQRGTNGATRYGLEFYTGYGRRMSILNNGRIGIATTNPAALLDVNGKAKMAQFQLGSAATAGSVLRADASGNGTWQSAAFVSLAGDTMSGDLTIANPNDLNFGSSTRQMINLYATGYGIGVQANTLYQRSDGGFAWFRYGVHNSGQNNAGSGGTNLMLLDPSGNLSLNASVTVDGISANSGSYYPGLVFGGGSGEAISSKRTSGGNQYGIDFYTGFAPRFSIANNGNVGINTTAPGGLLDINTGNGRVQFIDDLVPGINVTGGSIPGTMRLRNALEVWPSQDGSRAGYVDVRDGGGNANIVLRGSGVATVKVLEITGGADVAEPFQITTGDVPKGAVVVIDDENPGRLKMSDRAYDTRVAGIVSGANGIRPGLALHQEGALEGGQNVALTGRVYALADATSEPIQPGDLLTSSAAPGHVMKVTDRARGAGAILGKAMTGLKNGKGMVLVLVSLQ